MKVSKHKLEKIFRIFAKRLGLTYTTQDTLIHELLYQFATWISYILVGKLKKKKKKIKIYVQLRISFYKIITHYRTRFTPNTIVKRVNQR